MSTELPDFQSAPAWMLSDGVVLDALTARASVQIEPTYAQRHTPWTPLDTAEAWVRRIDRDGLADVIDRTQEPGLSPALRRRIGASWAREIADAVIAALPELTKEEA